MNITKIISKVFDSRLKAIDLYDTQAGEIQHRVLTRLVKQAENTEWGKKYDYKSIRNYEDFKNRLPIQTYEEVKPYVERLRGANKTCCGLRRYAGLPNLRVQQTIRVNSSRSARKPWRIFITGAEKMQLQSTFA